MVIGIDTVMHSRSVACFAAINKAVDGMSQDLKNSIRVAS